MEIKEEKIGKHGLDEIGIGEDKPQIMPKPVTVVSYKIEMQKDSSLKDIGNKLTLSCSHPDVKENTIELSSIKFENIGKIKKSGLWVKMDNDGCLPYKSATSQLLRFYKVNTIKELIGRTLQTTTDEAGYLLIKAY